MPKRSTGSFIVEGLADAIRNYTAIKNQERTLANELTINKMKAEQNWVYKMKEMQEQQRGRIEEKKTLNPLEEQQLAYQKLLEDKYKNQNAASPNLTPETNVLTEEPQPEIRMGERGFETKYSEPKDWIFKRIQEKEKRGFALSKNEQKFRDRYLGAKQENDVKALSNLRQEFINRPEVKEFITIGTQVKSMDALLSNALAGGQQNKVALDQALITMYNKLTDPNSVVRESEYARTPENLPVINRIQGAIQKVKSGGAGLTMDDRKALVLGAKIIANERGKVFNSAYDDYREIAEGSGLDPELATRKMDRFTEYDVGPGNNQSQSQFIEGKVYRDANGNKARYSKGSFIPTK